MEVERRGMPRGSIFLLCLLFSVVVFQVLEIFSFSCLLSLLCPLLFGFSLAVFFVVWCYLSLSLVSIFLFFSFSVPLVYYYFFSNYFSFISVIIMRCESKSAIDASSLSVQV